MADSNGAPLPVAVLTAWDYKAAIAIAVATSLVFAVIEISNKAKTNNFSAIFVSYSIFYWLVLSFGNIVTTLLATTTVTKMPASLADYYYFLSAFFGIFAFEAILKNTNITMFDKGVLIIQDWIDKSLNTAAAAAIDRQEQLKQQEELKLVAKLTARTDKDINTRILAKFGKDKVTDFDAAAAVSRADPKLYKVLQLITTLSPSERSAILQEKPQMAPSSAGDSGGLTNNDLRILLSMEDGENRLPSQIEDRAKDRFQFQIQPGKPLRDIDSRMDRFVDLGLAEKTGGSEYRITPYGISTIDEIRRNPNSYRSVLDQIAASSSLD